MIKRIELTNFMSHAHTVIEPAAGLTVLVGPNNCGKSAIVAALQILSSNEPSNYVTRHGARECSVIIETDDGHVIEWRRKKSPSYVIDGQKFDRLGKSGVPDELHAALRLPKIDAGDNTDFDIHFGTQKLPIFLLAGPASNAARFFASSSDAIRLVAMQKRHKFKLDNARRDKAHLEAESKRVNSALEILEPVVDLEKRLASAGEEYHTFQRTADWVFAAEASEAALRAQLAGVHGHHARVEALGGLSRPPEIPPTERLQDVLKSLLAADRERDTAASRAGELAKLPRPLELAPIEPLQTLLRAAELEAARRIKADSRTRALTTLRPAPELLDTSVLGRLIPDMARMTWTVEYSEDESISLSRLAAPPPLADVASLDLLLERLTMSDRDVARLRKKKNALLEGVSSPPELPKVLELAGILRELSKAVRKVKYWQGVAQDIDLIASVPSIFDGRELGDLIERLEAGFAHVATFEAAARTTDRLVKETAANLRVEADGRLCPICGSELDADRVIAQASIGHRGHEHG